MRMTHITMNSGHSMTVDESKFLPEVVECLSPLVDNHGGNIPFCSPWRVVLAKERGCASFDIRKGAQDIVCLNSVAWTEEGSAIAWALMEKIHLDASDRLSQLGMLAPGMDAFPEKPPSLPWLATFLMPQAQMLVGAEEMSWMPDFEQCLAKTIIEKCKG